MRQELEGYRIIWCNLAKAHSSGPKDCAAIDYRLILPSDGGPPYLFLMQMKGEAGSLTEQVRYPLETGLLDHKRVRACTEPMRTTVNACYINVAWYSWKHSPDQDNTESAHCRNVEIG